MLSPVKKATCRTFLCALAFTSFAGAQIVERSRTLADLLQSHPCNSGLAGRHTIVTDCDAADDLGNGGGAFSCFARCDGVDTWAAVSIGGGAGGGLSDDDYGDVAVSGSGTAMTVEALRGGAVTVAATTGNLQWEGTTADAFEGNFTFADPTADWTWDIKSGGQLVVPAGSQTFPGLGIALPGAGAGDGWGYTAYGGTGWLFFRVGFTALYLESPTLYFIRYHPDAKLQWSSAYDPTVAADTGLARAAAGVVSVTDGSTGGGALHLNPMASPPRTCDATAEGDIYSDTSHALCFCDGTSWNVLTGSGAGSCA